MVSDSVHTELVIDHGEGRARTVLWKGSLRSRASGKQNQTIGQAANGKVFSASLTMASR